MFPFRKRFSKILIFGFSGDFGYPWVILAHVGCLSVHISAHLTFPWTVSVLIFAQEDFLVHISARWPFQLTVRLLNSYQHACPVCQYTYQHVGPSHGQFVYWTHISTLALPMDCPSVHTSARWPFPWTVRGMFMYWTHISTLALPMDCPWTVHVLNSYQHAGPSHGLSVDLCWLDFFIDWWSMMLARLNPSRE